MRTTDINKTEMVQISGNQTYTFRVLIDRLHMILSHDDFNRITKKWVDIDAIHLVVDVHGMNCYQARRLIKNIINMANCTFQLEVIHGYSHGTAIKDMLAQNFKNSHVREQYQDYYNKGLTHMLIAA